MKPINVRSRVIIQALFAIYMYALFKIILFKFGSMDVPFLWEQLKQSLRYPHQITMRLQDGNLTPLKEVSRAIHGLSSHELTNLIGNIVIFMPYGVFLGFMSKNKRLSMISVFLCSLGLSLCLECAQVLFSIGRFDVDDLLLNSSGGFLGCLAFKSVGNASHSS